MKNIFLSAILALCAAVPAQATVVTSQANGNATSPTTWNCFCIPVDGDTIVINHAIVLDVDYAFTMGGIQVNAGGSVTGDASTRIFGVSGGYFINSGTVSIAYIFHTGGSFTNNGTLTATRNMGLDLGVTVVNYGSLYSNDTLLINTGATLQNESGAICNAPELWIAGTILNNGQIMADNILNTGLITHASGSIALQRNLYNTGNIYLNAYTSIVEDIWNAENITVNAYVMARTLHNGDSIAGSAVFLNNATVSLAGDLYNSQTLNGGGDFCVLDSSINAGFVNGTLDICDITGGGWDINVGTEQGTVTHCANGPCTIGIEETATASLSIVPNPASDYVTITLPVQTTGTIRVIDVMGRVVIESPAVSQTQLNISGLAPGIYSVIITAGENSWEEKIVIE